MNCHVEADNVFGPQVDGACRNGFDFTLFFEQTLLSIVPSAVTIIASSIFFVHLLRQDTKVRLDARRSFRAEKQIPILLFAATQLALIVLWASPSNHSTAVSVPSAVLSLVVGFCLAALSYLEHTRSIRPSTIINLYLTFSILLDVAQSRTLWIRQANGIAVAAIFTTGLVAKAAMLVAEAVEKQSILDNPYASYPPEAIGGILNRSVFWWINSLLLRGSSTRLSLGDLFDLDVKLTSEHIEPRFRRVWGASSKTSSYPLLVTALKCFRFKIFTIVVFRLCLIGFKFSQPLLIHRAVSLLDEPDSQEKSNVGRSLIGATSLIYMGIAVTTGAFRHNVYRLITMVRSAIVGLIYRNTLSLDTKTANDSAALTLMSTDLESIASGIEVFDSLWAEPIEIGVAIYLLYDQIGVAFFAPIVTALAFLSVPIALRGVSARAQKQWLESIERRVATIASVLSNIKGVKMTGLSDLVSERLHAMRVDELKVAGKFRTMLAVAVIIGSISHVAIPVIMLITYVFVAQREGRGDELTSAKVFTALSLVSLLAYPIQNMAKAMPQLAAAAGCFQRIQLYVLNGGDRCYNGASLESGTWATGSTKPVSAPSDVEKLQRATTPATSPTATAVVPAASEKQTLLSVRNASFTIRGTKNTLLKDMSFTIRPDTWTIITGEVGSGKSILLLALLNELDLSSGSLDRAPLLGGGVGYCAQDAWLPNLSIRDIITANNTRDSTVDETWYNTVIQACVLRADFDELPFGDRTEIGSNGVSLSGGQKQRVSLARAVYSRKPLLILDDVLSGLDPTTEQNIVDEVFGRDGLLRQHSMAAILATHSVRHTHKADHVIVLQKGGTILDQGTSSQISRYLSYHQDIESNESQASLPSSNRPGESAASQTVARAADDVAEALADDADLARQTGDVRLYTYYFRALGWLHTVGIAVAIMTYSMFQKFPTLWVQWWAKAEVDTPGKQTAMYAGVYGAFCGISVISFSMCIWLLFNYGIPHSSIGLHATLLNATFNAPYWFFVSTDTGEIINRFSQDMSLVCLNLPFALIDTMFNAGVCIVGGVLITMGSKWSLTIYPALIVILYTLQKFYLRTSRQMRLLDLEAKTPLYSYFLETLRGIVTIKAFGWHVSAQQENARLLDSSQRPFYLMYSIQRWLILDLDLLVAGVATMIVALATHLKDSSAGALGVSLLNILTFSQDLTFLIRTWTDLETSLGAIARVKSFDADTPSEHVNLVSMVAPEQWPSRGNVEFRQTSISYKSGGDKVLRDVSLKFPEGCKVGICGRTGSGKSSLILSLLRMTELEGGNILIDDVPITSLPRSIVRQRVLAVPQDPLLLPGTVRFNVDPFSQHQDDKIIAMLDDIGLLDIVQSVDGGLDARMDSMSLSRGQQQLFCLGKALLCDSRVVVLDEITSSVDDATEEKMMALVSSRFTNRTVLAIAHHIRTLRNFDMIVVLDHGRVVETGSPDELLSRDSVFRELWDRQS